MDNSNFDITKKLTPFLTFLKNSSDNQDENFIMILKDSTTTTTIKPLNGVVKYILKGTIDFNDDNIKNLLDGKSFKYGNPPLDYLKLTKTLSDELIVESLFTQLEDKFKSLNRYIKCKDLDIFKKINEGESLFDKYMNDINYLKEFISWLTKDM